MITLPQFGLNNNPLEFEGIINASNPTISIPYFDLNFSVMLQFDDERQEVIMSRFPIIDGSYQPPVMMARNLSGDGRLFGANKAFIQVLNSSQNDDLMKYIEGVDKFVRHSIASFSFAVFNDLESVLRIYLCRIEVSSFACELTQRRSLKTFEDITVTPISLQIMDNEVVVVLREYVVKAPFNNMFALQILNYDRNLKLLKYFRGYWYGVSSLNRLCVLTTNKEGSLEERYFFSNDQNHNYTALTATANYLILKYSDRSNTLKGASVFAFPDNSFFSNDFLPSGPSRLSLT